MLPNGVYVSESEQQVFQIEPPTSGTYNYFLICRHRIKNIVGGEPAEFVLTRDLIPGPNGFGTLDSGDPSNPWYYVIVATITGVTTSGLVSATLSMPADVRRNLLSLVSGVDPNSDPDHVRTLVFFSEQSYPVPFASGVTLRTPAGSFPIPLMSKTPAATLTVSTIGNSGNTTTVVTASAHGLVTGDFVTIASCPVGGYNGTFGPITYIDATTFSYTQQTPAPPLASSGSPTKALAPPFHQLGVFSDDTGDPNERHVHYYKVAASILGFYHFIPNGLTIDKLYLLARHGTYDPAVASTAVIEIRDSAGEPIPFLVGSTLVDSYPISVTGTEFARYQAVPVTTNASLPSYGEFYVSLTLSNVDISGLIIVYKGAVPFLGDAGVLSSTGVITEVVISP